MNFDLATIGAMVGRLATKLLPGWTITCELASSVEANQGALAMVYSTPERQLAHVVVAPHPPGESLEESIAHELTHSVLSPLTKLIEWSPAAVMIEEQIVERLGKIIASAPSGLARAISKALQNPRTQSAEVRKRISALAIGRRNETRKRMDSKQLAALAMEGGALTAAENPDPAAMAEFIKKVVTALAGGGGEDVAPASGGMREGAPEEGKAPAMREEDMPPQYRSMFRSARRSAAMMLSETIKLRLHTARTVEGIVLDADTEKALSACGTIEQFEREFGIVQRLVGKGNEQQRNRSGALPPEDKGDKVPAGFSIDELMKDGLPRNVAQMIYDESKTNLESAKKMRTSARARLTREETKKGGKS